jgi:hypothetical protein
MVNLATVKQKVADLHDEIALAMRYGYYSEDGRNTEHREGCFNGLGNILSYANPNHPFEFIYTAFHGDGAPMTFDTIRSNKTFNEAMLAHTQPWNKFVGTDRSRRWVDFLLSDISPWRALYGNIAEKDPAYINNAGFIFQDHPTLPTKLAYNFAMASRFPWEMTRNYELFLRLWDDGMDPCIALYIAVNFMLLPTAEDLNGPYEVIYPWSFLEATNLTAVGRFVLGKPNDVSPFKSVQPNVFPLWNTETKEIKETHDKFFADLLADKNLRLPTIVGIIHDCLEQQRKAI